VPVAGFFKGSRIVFKELLLPLVEDVGVEADFVAEV
jgi:hypothetical protein